MAIKRTTLFALFLAQTASAESTYEFHPYVQKAGEVVRMTHTLSSERGRLTVTRGQTGQRGTIVRMHSRQLEHRIRPGAGSPGVRIKTVNDIQTVTNSLAHGGKPQSQLGPLVGRTASGKKDSAGKWNLLLEGAPPTEDQAAELAQLEAYENRGWFPERPVKVGESWDYEPVFIRHLMLRELGTVEIKATMTLEEIRSIDGEATAILRCELQTIGAKEETERASDASGATAALNATGTLQITLSSMLDSKLTLTGTLSSTSRSGDTTSAMSLPMTVEITKSVVQRP